MHFFYCFTTKHHPISKMFPRWHDTIKRKEVFKWLRGGSSLKFLVRQSVMLTMHPSLNVWTTLKSNLGILQISIVWSQDISRSFQIHISYILDAISDSCSPFSVLSPRCKRHLIPRSRPKSRPCEAGPIARSPCKLRGVSEKGGSNQDIQAWGKMFVGRSQS